MFNISNGKQLNLHSVSFNNVGGAFVSFDTFLVFTLQFEIPLMPYNNISYLIKYNDQWYQKLFVKIPLT